MSKSLAFILVNLISSVSYASWQESYFRAYLGGEISSIEQELQYQQESVGFRSQFQYLLDGAGIRGGLELMSVNTNLANYGLVNANYVLNAEGIAFLTHNSQLSTNFGAAQNYEPIQNDLKSSLQGIQKDFVQESKYGDAKLSIGSDADYFNLRLQLNKQELKKTSLDSINPSEIKTSMNYMGTALWKQSEDTRWGGKIDVVAFDTTREVTIREQSVQNTYVSMVSRYLGRNQIEINLGKTFSGQRDTFAWVIQNTTYLTDYVRATLTSSRKYSTPINPEFDVELNTLISGELNFQPSSYLQVGFNIEKQRRTISGAKQYEYWHTTANLEFLYSERWRALVSLGKQSLTDEINDSLAAQTTFNMKISRQLL